MLTSATDTTPANSAHIRTLLASSVTMQKVVIVNGAPEVMALLETLLAAGRYDVVFVEPNAHAYSQIKRVKPNLVVLCMSLADVEGFQILSMLHLDAETRGIPVMTYTAEFDSPYEDEAEPEQDDEPLFTTPRLEGRMN